MCFLHRLLYYIFKFIIIARVGYLVFTMRGNVKVLVTGANGYIGSHLVKRLLDCGHEVIAVDLKDNNIDSRALFFSVDIFKEKFDYYTIFKKPDVLVHLACKDVPVHNSIYHIESLPSHFLFIKEMIDNGLKHVVTVGSMHDVGYFEGAISEDTEPKPATFYGIAKDSLRRMVQVYAKENAVIHQHLRFFYTYGDDEKSSGSVFSKILKMAKEGSETFPFTDGKNKFDYIEINELAKQVEAVITQKEIDGIINCCSGKPVAIKEQVEMFISENHLNIRPDYGKYPTRPYDSPCVYGDLKKLTEILSQNSEKNHILTFLIITFVARTILSHKAFEI